MNVDVLVEWVQRSLRLLDSRKAIRAAGWKRAGVEAKLGWLRAFGPQVRRWAEMLAVAGTTEHYVRHEGIHRRPPAELAAALPKPTTPAARRLRKQLLEFVQGHSRQAHDDERLLGSSEVLESIIGKFKNLAGERGQHGLTGMALSIGALVGKPTVTNVQTAMTEITTQQVWDWCRSHLGPTVQSVRAKVRHALNLEQERKPFLLQSG